MSVPTQAPTEVIILQPEPLGGDGDADRTHRLDVAADTRKLSGPLTSVEDTAKLAGTVKLPGGDADSTTKLDRGAGTLSAQQFDIEIEADQGIAPLVRAAETVLRQGKRHVVLSLGHFAALEPEDLRALVEARDRFEKAHGLLVVTGVQPQVRRALEALDLERGLDLALTPEDALGQIEARVAKRQATAGQSSAMDLHVHEVELGGGGADLSFADGKRRRGPDGLTRELVVLQCSTGGVAKVAETVRKLSQRALDSFVVDLGEVSSLEGGAVKELIKAQKHVESRGGYLSVANARDAVAGLMRVMGLDRDLPTFETRDAGIEAFKQHLAQKGAGRDEAAAPVSGDATSQLATAHLTRPGEGELADNVRQLGEAKPGELVFVRGDAEEDSARENVVTIPKVVVSKESLAALAGTVTGLAGARRLFIMVDLGPLSRIDASGVDHLVQASAAARDAGALVVFADVSPEAASVVNLVGVGDELELFRSESAAGERLARQVLGDSGLDGVVLRLAEHEVADVEPVHKTAQFAVPDFDDDDDEPRRLEDTDKLSVPRFQSARDEEPVHKTAQFAVPDFDDDDDDDGAGESMFGRDETAKLRAPDLSDTTKLSKPGFDETDKLGVPSFDETGKLGVPSLDETGKLGAPSLDETAKLVAPSFADESGDAHRTAQFAAPDFDEDDDDTDQPVHKTAQFSVPNFDDDEDEEEGDDGFSPPIAGMPDFEEEAEADEQPVHKTAQFSVPNFDDDEDEEDEDDGFSPPIAGTPDFEEETAGEDGPVHETAQFSVPDFDDDEDDDDEAGPSGAGRTAMVATPDFDDDDGDDSGPSGAGRTAMVSTPDFDDEDDGGDEAEAPAGAEGDDSDTWTSADAPVSAEEAAPAARDMRHAKTEMMQGVTEDVAAPAPAPPEDLRSARTEMLPGLSPEEARRLAAAEAEAPAAAAPAPAPFRDAKTQALPGMSREEALRLAAGEAQVSSAPAAPAPAAPGMRDAKTQAIPGLSKEEALAQVRAGAADGAAPAALDLQTQQTDRMDGMSRGEANVREARTEAMPGLSRGDAARKVRQDMDRKTGEIATPGGPSAPARTMGLPAILGGLALVAVVAIGGWKLMSGNNPKPVTPRGTSPSSSGNQGAGGNAQAETPGLTEARAKLKAAIEDAFARD